VGAAVVAAAGAQALSTIAITISKLITDNNFFILFSPFPAINWDNQLLKFADISLRCNHIAEDAKPSLLQNHR
jgi:hypothetical protein